MREQGSGTRIIVAREFQKRGLPLRIKLELGSNEAIKRAVAGDRCRSPGIRFKQRKL